MRKNVGMTNTTFDVTKGYTLLRSHIGKRLRTQDPAFFNCGRPKAADDSDSHAPHIEGTACSADDMFGGEGVLEDVFTENGVLGITLGWGWSAYIDATTEVFLVEEGGNYVRIL